MSKPALRKGAKTYKSYAALSKAKGTQKDDSQDKQIKRIQREIKLMRPEMKYIDYYNTTAATAGFVAFPLSIVGQGDDFNQRIGEEIKVHWADIAITMTRLVNTSTNLVRMIVFWDKQSNAETVFHPIVSLNAAEGLIDDSTIINQAIAPFNDRCKDRYAILFEHLFNFSPTDSLVQTLKVLKKRINLSSALIKYADSGATTASLTSRSLLIAYYGMGTSVSHNTTCRLHYSDA